jgi:hypothetical protein
MAALSLAWTAAFALLGLVVLRLRMPRPSRVVAPARPGPQEPAQDRHAPAAGTRQSTASHHQTLTAAAAQASGGPGRNPGESGLPADQRVVPPPAARAG